MVPFTFTRRAPLCVLTVLAELPLVRVGGDSLHELREDVFDAARNANCRARAFRFDTYASALMGGEPYALWV